MVRVRYSIFIAFLLIKMLFFIYSKNYILYTFFKKGMNFYYGMMG